MVLVGAAELTFWNEFASRFNFIAVDYLIYTNEVIGNIRESYNMPLLLSLVAVVALALWWVIVRRIAPLVSVQPGGPGARSIAVLIWMLALLIVVIWFFYRMIRGLIHAAENRPLIASKAKARALSSAGSAQQTSLTLTRA